MVEFLISFFKTLLISHWYWCSSLAGKESNQWHHSDILLEGIFTTIRLTLFWNPSNSHPIFCNLCHSSTTSQHRFFRQGSIYLDTTVAMSFSDQLLSREKFACSLVISHCFSRVFSSWHLDPCIWEQNLADRVLETKKLNHKLRFALRELFVRFFSSKKHACSFTESMWQTKIFCLKIKRKQNSWEYSIRIF